MTMTDIGDDTKEAATPSPPNPFMPATSEPIQAHPIVHADPEVQAAPTSPFYPGATPIPENYKIYRGHDDLTAHEPTPLTDADRPVSDAEVADAKKRLAEGRLFRNGIVSYRIPEWDAGHIDRGVKYRYVTEAMVSAAPPIPSYRNELAAAITAGSALPLTADGSVFKIDDSVKAPTAEEVAEAVAYLIQAKERMAVNSMSDVGFYIGRAIQLLEG
jgi:hypothetical protein